MTYTHPHDLPSVIPEVPDDRNIKDVLDRLTCILVWDEEIIDNSDGFPAALCRYLGGIVWRWTDMDARAVGAADMGVRAVGAAQLASWRRALDCLEASTAPPGAARLEPFLSARSS